MKPSEIKPGDVFTYLTVEGLASRELCKRDVPNWVCRCVCGAASTVRGRSLTRGLTKSCGCMQKALGRESHLKHGKCYTATYRAWAGALSRCRNTKAKCYENYGGRGIKFCWQWLKFERFLADMGERPSPKHSIDRKDNDGHYCKENCRWATKAEQLSNRRTTIWVMYRGQKILLSDYCKDHGLEYSMMRHRITKQGMSLAAASMKPIKHFEVTVDGVVIKLSKYCKDRGLDYFMVSHRIKRGWTLERAISEPTKKQYRAKVSKPQDSSE